MPFTPTEVVESYRPSAPPVISGADKLYLDRELRQISLVIDRMVAAVAEMQDYLKTLP